MLAWLGGPSANLAIAAVHFAAAATISQLLETNDQNRRFIEHTLSYTPVQTPGPATITVNVKTLIVFFLAVTGAFHVLYALAGNAAVSLRFVEYALTASVMLVIIQLLSGETDGDLVLACAVLTASTMFFGLLQDDRLRIRSIGGKAWWLGWIPFAAAWFFVVKRFFFTLSQSDNVPEFVRQIVWVELALFSCFAVVQYIFLVRRDGAAAGAADPGAGAVGDRQLKRYSGAYNVLSITAKLFLALMAFFGLRSMK